MVIIAGDLDRLFEMGDNSLGYAQARLCPAIRHPAAAPSADHRVLSCSPTPRKPSYLFDPLAVSTALPTKSMLVPYSQRVPGSLMYAERPGSGLKGRGHARTNSARSGDLQWLLQRLPFKNGHAHQWPRHRR